MEAAIVILAAFILYREWRFDRERAAWTREREKLVEGASGVRLTDTKIEPKNRRWDDQRSAENYRRRMQQRGEFAGVSHE